MYHVIHKGRIILTASNPTSARHQAIEYGSKLDKPTTMHLYDGTNYFHVGSIMTEPKSEFDEHSGLKKSDEEESKPEILESKNITTSIKKSSQHAVFDIKVFFDEKDPSPKFFMFDHDNVFDIDNDDWVDNPNAETFQGLSERGVTSTDLGVLAAHDLLDEKDVDELHNQGYPVSHVKAIFGKMGKIKQQMNQIISSLHGDIGGDDDK